MIIKKSILIIFILLFSYQFAQSEIPKPTKKQLKIFEDIIKPNIEKLWKNQKRFEDKTWLIQNIKEINLNRVDIIKYVELYIVALMYHVNYYNQNNIKYDEAEYLQNIMFQVSENKIIVWYSMSRIRLKTIPVNKKLYI